MTKKHFIAVAEMISKQEPEQRQKLAEWFADFFARYNKSFDRQRFLTACGIAPGVCGLLKGYDVCNLAHHSESCECDTCYGN